MKAIVLAAGKSTRLYPLTAELPKALLPVGSRTILDHQIECLIENGITELIIVVGYNKEKIIAHLEKRKYPLKISFIENARYENSGPISGLWVVREYLTKPLIFFHCDVLFTSEAIKELLAHPSDTVFLYRPDAWDVEAGKIIVGENGMVKELGKHIEQKESTGEYLQIAKFGNEFLLNLSQVVDMRIREGRDGYTIDAFNETIQTNEIYAAAHPYHGFATEIDTKEDYETALQAWDKRQK